MGLLQTVCTFLNFSIINIIFTLPIFRLNEFWGGWKLDPWTFKRIQCSVRVQRCWPFLAPLVDKHLHSRSFPAEHIQGRVSIWGNRAQICQTISFLRALPALGWEFHFKMSWEFIDMPKVVKFPFCCLSYQGVIFVSSFLSNKMLLHSTPDLPEFLVSSTSNKFLCLSAKK